ncbi:low temperature requirement protein A [Streptomyces sp. NPDC048384]|uniref:low temperature requirement protein A n=1 Tax=unclassified Streptomyces TaxID=2593676 RepID=UPI00342F7086
MHSAFTAWVSASAQTSVLLFAVWWAWFTNFFDPGRPSVRLVLIALIPAGLVMSVALPEAFGDRGRMFVVAYLTLQIGRHIHIVVSIRGHRPAHEFGRPLG